MKKFYQVGVAVWIVANVLLFLAPSLTESLAEIDPSIDGSSFITVWNQWMSVINRWVAVLLAIVGLFAYNSGRSGRNLIGDE